MYFIDKEDIENYRFAIAKTVFLRIYTRYQFVRDITKSNCMWCIHPDSHKECIIALFRNPNIKVKSGTEVVSFYQKLHYKRAVEKYGDLQIIKLSSDFDNMFDVDFAQAIQSPEEYMSKLEDRYLPFFNGIVLMHEDLEGYNRTWYKYYSEEKVKTNKHEVVDGSISFVDPSTFNDPFDVNCFFANGVDLSHMFRIFCVAPTQKEILMWSYYGSNHKGYCFEYNEHDILSSIINSKQKGLCIIGAVTYTDSRPAQKSKLNNISFSEIRFYIQAAFSKFKEWEHEKEYRYVLLSNTFSSSSLYESFTIPVQNIYNGIKGNGLSVMNKDGKAINTIKISKDNRKYELI